jgi:(S)-2-hydroxyglutarate dehydrogenase
MHFHSDLLIIGGGIVGLATAYRLSQKQPGRSITLLDKESHLAAHQTGHNSGVLHTGIYYQPGSLKAQNCLQGRRSMIEFCQQHDVPYEICGKVIVAVDPSELPALQQIYQRGQQNMVQCEKIGVEQLREIEPHTAGIAAIHVPEAGIVDYRQVCQVLGEQLHNAGHQIQLSCKVLALKATAKGAEIRTTCGDFSAQTVINCSGLYSDKLTRKAGIDPEAKIVPFRGEYFELSPEAHHLCRNLIYPVPNPAFPFLGVHFTRMIDGSVECGPNAVLAFRREGYTRSAIHLGELFESLTYPGFVRLASKFWRTGCGEMYRSFSKRAFTKALQRLVPDIQAAHMKPAPAGVRAQALRRTGELVDDFLILENEWGIHVCNAPSPAATSSLNIGEMIAARVPSA